MHEVTDSHSGVDNSSNKAMNNSNRQTPKYRNHFKKSNHRGNYSRYQYEEFPYPNEFENQAYCYGRPPYSSYSRWNIPPFSNAPLIPNNSCDFGSNQYYTNPNYRESYENNHFSENGHVYFNPRDNLDKGPHLPGNSVDSESSSYKTSQLLESNSVSSESANKSRSKDYSKCINLSSSDTAKSRQSTSSVSDLNKSSISTIDANISQTSQLSNNSSSKVGEKKQVRSRSLSSSEILNNEKRLKDKNESQSVDSGGASEQKLKEYTTSLLETNPNQISRIIQHPSNYKEKAALNHIMTSFSRTKRKENLTRKLRSNSLGSAENNNDDGTSEEVQSAASETEEVSIIFPSDVTSAQTNTDLDQNKSPPIVRKSKKNSVGSSNFDSQLNSDDSLGTNNMQIAIAVSVNKSSKQTSKVDGKSRERNLSTSSKKSPEKRKEKNSLVYPEKTVKRKNLSYDTNSKGKKQKFYDVGNFEKPKKTYSKSSKTTEQMDLSNDTSTESLFNPPSSTKARNSNSVSQSSVLPVKEEIADTSDVNEAAVPEATSTQNAQNQILDFNSEMNIETLIELFASGNVMVKNEFNDPAIDAIKSVNPDELMNACSNESFLNKVGEIAQMPLESSIRNSKDKSASELCLMNTVHGNTNSIAPVNLGSAVASDNITPAAVALRSSPSLPNPSSCEKSKDQSPPLLCNSIDKDADNSLSETQKLNLLSQTKSKFPQLDALIKQLQEIASHEENVKQKISEAKSKINEFHELLEEWKYKKKKLHGEEEDLRKKRNDIIQLMQNAVTATNDISTEDSQTASLSEVHSTTDQPVNNTVQNPDIVVDKRTENSFRSSTPASSPEVSQKQKKNDNSTESDEITILPSPVKPKPPEIILYDDTEENTAGTQGSKKNFRNAGRPIIVTNIVSGPNIFDVKNLNAHSTIINSLMVFEDFLYTCSNDNTAKRFNLKDASQTITYLHSAKNVTDVVVEKVQNEALVFTSCSSRMISLFIASNGTKIKTFFTPCAVHGICKGWGKFYAGLANGSVNVYNWKYEEKEIVRTQSSVSRIATAHQGRLHVLFILTENGDISLRDAETGLLIRAIKGFAKPPALLTVHNDLAYLNNSEKILFILDIMSGKVENKLQLASNSTGLAVCGDHVFTTSYTGLVNCYNKDNVANKKLYYGAGKNGLTCVHVYQEWVFTGNRKGDVSLFKFDPCSSTLCQFGNCNSTYGLKEDLEFHIEKDHLSKKKNISRCYWDRCAFIYPNNYDTRDKMNHVKNHLYNLTI